MVTVDEVKGRASLYQVDSESREVTLGGGSYTDTVTMETPGSAGRVCTPPLTFALSVRGYIYAPSYRHTHTPHARTPQADFTDTSPISVRLSIDDIPEPLPLETTPTSSQLGGALHPILRRYERGDIPLPLSLDHMIVFNVNCTSGLSAACEPSYAVDIEKSL